jgi:hypothetical protein
MIKLQLLLRHPAQRPEIDPGLRARLDALGLHVTASGRASISVEASAADAEQLFGPLAVQASGFAPSLAATPDLPVPTALADAISLITIAPQHIAATPPP